GLVPLHVWLPLAHPAAPSHVSALMSGVMTKVAIYGFVRIVFDLSGAPSWWWSIPVLTIAGVTTVMGVLYALMEHDLKRLLAYHTPRHSLSGLRRNLGCRVAHSDVPHRALVLVVGGPNSDRGADRQRQVFSRARRARCRHELWRDWIESRGHDRFAR